MFYPKGTFPKYFFCYFPSEYVAMFKTILREQKYIFNIMDQICMNFQISIRFIYNKYIKHHPSCILVFIGYAILLINYWKLKRTYFFPQSYSWWIAATSLAPCRTQDQTSSSLCDHRADKSCALQQGRYRGCVSALWYYHMQGKCGMLLRELREWMLSSELRVIMIETAG